jgi:hypothetical protein
LGATAEWIVGEQTGQQFWLILMVAGVIAEQPVGVEVGVAEVLVVAKMPLMHLKQLILKQLQLVFGGTATLA